MSVNEACGSEASTRAFGGGREELASFGARLKNQERAKMRCFISV